MLSLSGRSGSCPRPPSLPLIANPSVRAQPADLSDPHASGSPRGLVRQRQGAICLRQRYVDLAESKRHCVRMLTEHVEPRTPPSNLGLGHSVNRVHFVPGPADLRPLSAARVACKMQNRCPFQFSRDHLRTWTHEFQKDYSFTKQQTWVRINTPHQGQIAVFNE